MYTKSGGRRGVKTPRPCEQIVEQLAELLKIKRGAVANGQGDRSDSMMFATLERLERSLYAELRDALVPRRHRKPRRRAS